MDVSSDGIRREARVRGGIGATSASARADVDPWEQLRARGEKATITAMEHAEKRKQRRNQEKAAIHGQDQKNRHAPNVITARSNPLVVQCRKLLREQTRKKAGVVKIEGIDGIMQTIPTVPNQHT